jgi:hypothetical protein
VPSNNLAVNQERFHGVADARALHFGVITDRLSHLQVGRSVHEDMADAFVVLDDRDLAALGHGADEAFAAARKCAADFDWDAAVGNMVYVWYGLLRSRKRWRATDPRSTSPPPAEETLRFMIDQ